MQPTPSRRTIARGAAWAAPAVVLGAAAPAFASSPVACAYILTAGVLSDYDADPQVFRRSWTAAEGIPAGLFLVHEIRSRASLAVTITSPLIAGPVSVEIQGGDPETTIHSFRFPVVNVVAPGTGPVSTTVSPSIPVSNIYADPTFFSSGASITDATGNSCVELPS